jgi:hypothetical protein
VEGGISPVYGAVLATTKNAALVVTFWCLIALSVSRKPKQVHHILAYRGFQVSVCLFFAKCGICFVHSCYLICIHKENTSGYDIKGYTLDVYLAVMAFGSISVYSFVFLICHDLDSLPDINRFVKSKGTRWVAVLTRMGEREMHALVLRGNLKEGDRF